MVGDVAAILEGVVCVYIVGPMEYIVDPVADIVDLVREALVEILAALEHGEGDGLPGGEGGDGLPGGEGGGYGWI